MMMLWGPDISQPLVFLRSDRKDTPNVFMFQIQGRQPLQGFGQFQTDMIDIAELFRHGEQRSQHDSHGLFHAVSFIDDSVGRRINPQSIGNPRQSAITDALDGFSHTVVKGCSKQP